MADIRKEAWVNLAWITQRLDQQFEHYRSLSDTIWTLAETKFQEFKSSAVLGDALEQAGFAVEYGVGGLPTAFIGTYGTGYPVIAFLGEYDALPAMSQRAGSKVEEAIQAGGNGHGCGHHLLGTGSLAAAITTAQYMQDHQLTGTIRYYGCPAEEGGSGKTFMVREGLFADADTALTWHPGYNNAVVSHSSAANYQVRFRFHGVSAHAGISPHKGRSALDAVELMNVGANYLREHIIPKATFHYAVTNTGGNFPNVVQPEAEVVYLIRAPQVKEVEEIYERINNVARGAALMTGTEVEIIFEKACSNLIPNMTLETVMFDCFKQIGVPQFSDQEQQYATEIAATLQSELEHTELEHKSYLLNELEEYKPLGGMMLGSTDVSDVSWVIPTAQLETVCYAEETPFHSWQMVAQGKSGAAHKGMLHAAKIMTATAIRLLLQPSIIEEAKKELRGHGGMEGYVCPIPPHVKPPLHH